MKQKVYARVASVLKWQLKGDYVMDNTVAKIARELAEEFKMTNPRFRYDTFFEACGLSPYGDINRDDSDS